MNKIKLVGRGWTQATGLYFGVEFKDGVSVSPVAPAQVRLIGSVVQIEVLEGDDVRPAFLDTQRSVKAEVAPPRKSVAERQGEVEKVERKVEEIKQAKYTREELEKIADEKGIVGIREIATSLGIKGRQIGGMIDDIVEKLKVE